MSGSRDSAVRRALQQREQSRRRLTLLTIGVLIVLGTSPVYAHHLFALGGARLLAGLDHLGALCMTALHLLLLPVHNALHVVILAGVSYAIWDRARAWRALRRSVEPLELRSPAVGDPFWRAAGAAGVDVHRVWVVRGLPNPAFTIGLLAPRIVLAEELARRLTPSQLVAVIAHEAAHVNRRDPLRLFLLRLLACTLFWIPALGKLERDAQDEAEVLADDAAARENPLELAAAILALASWRDRRQVPALGVGFQRDELLDRRVRRLAGEDVPARSHVTRRSVLAATFALGVVWSTGVVMAHPLPAQSAHAPAHCAHHGGSAFAHLFCLGSPFTRSLHPDCPHRGR